MAEVVGGVSGLGEKLYHGGLAGKGVRTRHVEAKTRPGPRMDKTGEIEEGKVDILFYLSSFSFFHNLMGSWV